MLLLLDKNVISRGFIHSIRLALLTASWSNCRGLGRPASPIHFSSPRKCILYRHFLLNTIWFHKLQAPITRDWRSLHDVHALRFLPICYFYSGRLRLSSWNFRLRSVIRIGDRPKRFSRWQLHLWIKQKIPLERWRLDEGILVFGVNEYIAFRIWDCDFGAIMIVLDVGLNKEKVTTRALVSRSMILLMFYRSWVDCFRNICMEWLGYSRIQKEGFWI